jgi:hypothetical protein
VSARLVASSPTTTARVRLRLVPRYAPSPVELPDPEAHGEEDRASMWVLGWFAIAFMGALVLMGLWFGARRLHEANPALSAALWMTVINVFLLYVVAKAASR